MTIHYRQTDFIFEAACSTNMLGGPVEGKDVGLRHLWAGRGLSNHLLQTHFTEGEMETHRVRQGPCPKSHHTGLARKWPRAKIWAMWPRVSALVYCTYNSIWFDVVFPINRSTLRENQYNLWHGLAFYLLYWERTDMYYNSLPGPIYLKIQSNHSDDTVLVINWTSRRHLERTFGTSLTTETNLCLHITKSLV